MNTLRIVTISMLAIATTVVAPLIYAEGQSLTPNQIKMGDFPNSPLAKGAKVAVIMGNPEQGPAIMRVSVPAGYKVLPHSHPDERTLTVLSGTLYYAEGDKFDARKLKAYPPGSFIVEPANQPHFMRAKGASVFQATATGPTDFVYVNPKDDPRKK